MHESNHDVYALCFHSFHIGFHFGIEKRKTGIIKGVNEGTVRFLHRKAVKTLFYFIPVRFVSVAHHAHLNTVQIHHQIIGVFRIHLGAQIGKAVVPDYLLSTN